MNKEAFEAIQLSKRPEVISTNLGAYLYDDAEHRYKPVLPHFNRSVSNAESFAAYIKEEAARRANEDGNKITAAFNLNGGNCLLDDGDLPDTINYRRVLSPQWEFLSGHLDRAYCHSDVLRIFQKLRPSFLSTETYSSFMRQYRKVTFSSDVSVTSQPLVEQGKSGSSMTVEFVRGSGANNSTELPADFPLTLQYARGSSRRYDVEIEIESELKEKNGKGEILFTLLWPERENVIAQAIEDEIADFKAAIKELPKILVVMNY